MESSRRGAAVSACRFARTRTHARARSLARLHACSQGHSLGPSHAYTHTYSSFRRPCERSARGKPTVCGRLSSNVPKWRDGRGRGVVQFFLFGATPPQIDPSPQSQPPSQSLSSPFPAWLLCWSNSSSASFHPDACSPNFQSVDAWSLPSGPCSFRRDSALSFNSTLFSWRRS